MCLKYVTRVYEKCFINKFALPCLNGLTFDPGQSIQRRLEEIEVTFKELEEKGVVLERALRGEPGERAATQVLLISTKLTELSCVWSHDQGTRTTDILLVVRQLLVTPTTSDFVPNPDRNTLSL